MTKAKNLTNQLLKTIGFKGLNDSKSELLRSKFYTKDVTEWVQSRKIDLISAFGKKSVTARKLQKENLNIISLLKEMLREHRKYLLHQQARIKRNQKWVTTYRYSICG